MVLRWGYEGSGGLPPGASTVQVRLVPVAGGTRAELEHRDLPGPEVAGHRAGWTHYLARLQRAGAGDDPGLTRGCRSPAGPIEGQAPPMACTMVPRPSHSGQGPPSTRPEPLHSGQTVSPAGAPSGGASSPGAMDSSCAMVEASPGSGPPTRPLGGESSR